MKVAAHGVARTALFAFSLERSGLGEAGAAALQGAAGQRHAAGFRGPVDFSRSGANGANGAIN